MDNSNLWPDFEDVPKILSPRTILIEQANFLAEKTKNLLTAKVLQTNTGDGSVIHHFRIIAPLLKNYAYSLFMLSHGIFYYPCNLKFSEQSLAIKNEDELRERLRFVFNHKTTIDIITSLLGQSKEFENGVDDLPF
jgi:hypothetical protein